MTASESVAVPQSRVDTMFESMRAALQDPPSVMAVVGAILAAVVLIILLWLLARWYGERRVVPPPDYLKIAADHLQLDRAVLRWLKRVARAAELPQPAVLLLSPANLARGVYRAAEQLPDPDLLKTAERTCRLLYGAALPAAESVPR